MSRADGAAAEIVLVPGHLCGEWLYAPQIAALGGRPHHVADVTRDRSIAAMAERLLADTSGPLVLVGLSMGGMVAMEAMAAAPERIAGALLLDTDPHTAREKEVAWRRGERARVAEAGVAVFSDPFSARSFSHRTDGGGDLAARVAARMRTTPGAVFGAQADALDAGRDLVEAVAPFPGPVEIAVGAEDRICPPRLHAPLAARLADVRLTEMPGTGHLASVEAPETVTALLMRLLARARA